ncbi:MAG: thiamine pyrophosphate-dependent enzyme [Acidimicrobiales bacterium]
MDLFRAVNDVRTNEIVVTTMTATLQWPSISTEPELDFDFLAFGMGHASDFALGLALARPERRVIVFKGDGGLLMSLGSLVTLAEYGPENLVVILLENRSYEMTGGQALPSRVDFEMLGRGSGITSVSRWDTRDQVEHNLPRILTEPGPHFVVVPVTNREPLPAVAHTDHGSRVRKLRAALDIEPSQRRSG